MQAVALEDADFDAYCAYLHSEAFAMADAPDGLKEIVKAVQARGRLDVHGQHMLSPIRDAPSQCSAGAGSTHFHSFSRTASLGCYFTTCKAVIAHVLVTCALQS